MFSLLFKTVSTESGVTSVLAGLQNALTLKPTLIALEACHRLALSEGQKENEWKKSFPQKMEVTIK